MSTETVTLDNPISRGDTQITDITLRKPKAGELRGLNLNDILNMDVNSLTILLPRISSPMLTKDEARQLEPEDLLLLGVPLPIFCCRSSCGNPAPRMRR
ncbi:phage tail assembly protein [Shewanella dokdonensis]|uniref:Phage tail assembly protein n=1 Tax=Shewanella dokdonensis TaxID=712036 RepID=A0ABX8DD76_9GAMM|nr:phage tail assembly protein [Shewanella dokdonensis]QVK22191.1 phage tail assembly protein [Shewanella dokdonensis]